jgi:hypothetical protein
MQCSRFGDAAFDYPVIYFTIESLSELQLTVALKLFRKTEIIVKIVKPWVVLYL